MTAYDYVILVAGWLWWFLPFPLNGWHSGPVARRDPRARWGILLEGIGYAVLWQGPFWKSPPASWRVALAAAFLFLAGVLSWTAVRALGRHLRFEAALSEDHRLVRSGPYAIVRHPIYASMLALLLGTGLLVAPWILFAIALAVYLAGTEIRVRAEDALLLGRFGGEFTKYRGAVKAYVPWIR